MTYIVIKGKKYKAENPVALFVDKHITTPMKVILNTFHLANIYRAGWLEPGRNIPIPIAESDSEHILGMEYIADYLQAAHAEHFPGVKWERVCPMIRRHELSEIHTGDFTPADKLQKMEKFELENAGFKNLFLGFANASYDFELWYEYNYAKTPTAKLVHEIDFLQMIIKARIYEKITGKDLSAFYTKEKREAKLSPFLNHFFEQLLD